MLLYYRSNIFLFILFLGIIGTSQTIYAQIKLELAGAIAKDLNRQYAHVRGDWKKILYGDYLKIRNELGWFVTCNYTTKKKITYLFSYVEHLQLVNVYIGNSNVEYFLNRKEYLLSLGREIPVKKITFCGFTGLSYRVSNNNRKFITYKNGIKGNTGYHAHVYGYNALWLGLDIKYRPLKKVPLSLYLNGNFSMPFRRHFIGVIESKYTLTEIFLQNTLGCRLGIAYTIFKQKENAKK